jgi:hypothetical protein
MQVYFTTKQADKVNEEGKVCQRYIKEATLTACAPSKTGGGIRVQRVAAGTKNKKTNERVISHRDIRGERNEMSFMRR